MKILAVTVSDRKFFPGTLAAVNSFLHYHDEDPRLDLDVVVVSSGEYNEALTQPQIDLLKRSGKVRVMLHSEFAQPDRVLGAWQLKAYSPHDLSKDGAYDLVLGFDSDLVFASNTTDVMEQCLADGKWRGGKDGAGVDYGIDYADYGFSVPAHNVPYMSSSCYFCPLTETNRAILADWANKTDHARYGPQAKKIYPGHGDQGVLNACIYATTGMRNVELLDNATWSQHWVYEEHVVEWDGTVLFNYSVKRPMRTLHCGGSDKFWAKGHSDKRRTTEGSQRWGYAHWLWMLAMGPVSDWSETDPALVIADESSHIYRDLLFYHQLIEAMAPRFKHNWERLLWRWIARTTETNGQHRMMTMCGTGSMDQYIQLVSRLPDRSLVVEAGSYHGGSVVTLAMAMVGRHHEIWSVESFTGNLDNTVDGWPLPQISTYLANIKHKWPFLNINVIQLPGQFAGGEKGTGPF